MKRLTEDHLTAAARCRASGAKDAHSCPADGEQKSEGDGDRQTTLAGVALGRLGWRVCG
jgi:hypothetical protein